MRYIKIPEPIQLKVPGTGELVDKPTTFQEWLATTVLSDAKLGKTAKSLMAVADIQQKVEESNGVLDLNDNEWELLKDVVENPTNGYNTPVGVQLVGFLRAFLNAPDEKPSK